jgi:GNAT superfamily N-acetyltransferase
LTAGSLSGRRPAEVRPANGADGWDVIALIAGCWSEYPGCIMDVHGECPDLLDPAGAYRRLGGEFWVATDECGTVIATVGWRPLDPGRVELERLYVNPRWRRQGLANTLADLVEQTATVRRAREIELWSDSRFGNAHRFYEARGYIRAGADRELGDLSRTREHHFVKSLAPAHRSG